MWARRRALAAPAARAEVPAVRAAAPDVKAAAVRAATPAAPWNADRCAVRGRSSFRTAGSSRRESAARWVSTGRTTAVTVPAYASGSLRASVIPTVTRTVTATRTATGIPTPPTATRTGTRILILMAGTATPVAGTATRARTTRT